jgi:hypothetical protein
MNTHTTFTQETQDRISMSIDNAIVDIIVSNTGAMPNVISNGATHDEYLASYNEALGYLNSAETVFDLSNKDNAVLLARHNVLNITKNLVQGGVDRAVDNAEVLTIEILGIISKIDNLVRDSNEEPLVI